MVRITYKHLMTIFFATIIVFDHVVGLISYDNRYFITGNLNLLYIFAVVYFFYLVVEKDMAAKELLCFAAIICGYSVIQLLVNQNGFSFISLLVNIIKILLCFLVMKFFEKKGSDIDLKKAVFYCTNLYLVLFIVAMLVRTKYLWRLSDTVNIFETVRLQLLYNEPSEIGLHAGMLFLIIFGLFLEKKINIKLTIYLMAVNIILIFYAKALLGMAAVAVTVLFVLLIYIFNNFGIRRMFLFLTIIAALVGVGFFIVFSESTIAQRIMLIILLEDSSANYRLVVSWKILKETVKELWGFGVGFSRINSSYYLEKYHSIGFARVGITASYFNILVEGGYWGFGFIILIIKKMLSALKFNFRYSMLAVMIFLIIYQLMGSYFTNPFLWMMYGVILSLHKDKTIQKITN